MNTILAIPITLNRVEIKSQLRVKPATRAESDLESLLDLVESLARPKAIYREAYITEFGIDTVTVEEAVFHSAAMRRNLAEVGRVFPFVVTCGTEVEDTPIDRDDPLQDYWLRWIELALVRIGGEYMHTVLRDQHQFESLSEMNPGSAEAEVWPLEEQRLLFDLFGGPQVVEQAIGVRLLPTYLMDPEMSASGILFPSDTTYFNCQLCQREECPSRKAPFDAALWETIHSS